MSIVENPPPQWRAAVEVATIAAAWGMRPPVMAALLGIPLEHLQAWRHSLSDGWDDEAARRVAGIMDLRDMIFVSEPYTRWEAWWHLRWHEDSPLAGLSPLQAALADREHAMRVLTDYLWDRTLPGFG